MNLDLLKKLTKLANNNPNDNEANSAARRVCKMLEEANWSLPSKTPNIDAMKQGTWEGFKPTPAQQQHPWNYPRQGGPIFTQEMYDELMRKTREQEKEYRRGFYTGKDWNQPINEPLNNARSKRGFNPNEKSLKKCTKCGKEVMTGFLGRPERFICQDCVWSSF